MTGGRIKRLKKYLNSDFLLTYGDGISSVNIDKLGQISQKRKKLVTSNSCKATSSFWNN